MNRTQPQSALGRLQRQGVDGADDGGGGDHQGKLAEQLPGDARKKGGGQKYRSQHQGNAHDRPGDFLHGFDRRLLRRQALFDMKRSVFHDDDGIVHDDADRQNQREQGQQIDCRSPAWTWPQRRRSASRARWWPAPASRANSVKTPPPRPAPECRPRTAFCRHRGIALRRQTWWCHNGFRSSSRAESPCSCRPWPPALRPPTFIALASGKDKHRHHVALWPLDSEKLL